MDAKVAEKYRSIDAEYVDLIIREYENWTLMVHDNQNYLGKMIVWRVRPGHMQRFTDLTPAELMELQLVCRHAEFALYHLFRPDHMNNEMLGNLFHLHGGHAHLHITPRYAKPVLYRGREYIDLRWGRHPHIEGDKYFPTRAELHALRDDIKHRLP